MASVPTIVLAVLVGVVLYLSGLSFLESILDESLSWKAAIETGTHQHGVLILLRNIHIVTCIVKIV